MPRKAFTVTGMAFKTGTSVPFIYLHQMNNLIFKQYAP